MARFGVVWSFTAPAVNDSDTGAIRSYQVVGDVDAGSPDEAFVASYQTAIEDGGFDPADVIIKTSSVIPE